MAEVFIFEDSLANYNEEALERHLKAVKAKFIAERKLNATAIEKIKQFIDYFVGIIPEIEAQLIKMIDAEKSVEKTFSDSLFPELFELRPKMLEEIVYNLKVQALLSLLLSEVGISYSSFSIGGVGDCTVRHLGFTDKIKNHGRPLHSDEDRALYDAVIRPYIIAQRPEMMATWGKH